MLANKSKSQNILFIILCLIGIAILFFFICVTKGDCLNNYLYDQTDMFMDFYNSVRNACMENPYKQIRAIYPPFVFLVCKIFSCFIPTETIFMDFSDYLLTDYNKILLIKSSRGAYIAYFLFCIICVFLMVFFVKKICAENYVIISIIFLLSHPFWYAIDRGNIVFLATVLFMGFACMVNSSNKLHREIALILLAVVINMKIYPVLFAFIFLTEKKYMSFIKTAIYSALLFFVPFVFYGGFQSFLLMLKNVFTESTKIGHLYVNINFNITSIMINLSNFFEISTDFIEICNVILPLGVLILGIISMFFINKTWKKYLLITCIILLFPSTTAIYNGIFFSVPFLMFYNEPNKTKFDYLYAVLFSCCFIPIPICFVQNECIYSVSFILLTISTCVMTLLLLMESFFHFVIVLIERLTKTDSIQNQINQYLETTHAIDMKYIFKIPQFAKSFAISTIIVYVIAFISNILRVHSTIKGGDLNSYFRICYMLIPLVIILTMIGDAYIQKGYNIYVSTLTGLISGILITIFNTFLGTITSSIKLQNIDRTIVISTALAILLCTCLSIIIILFSKLLFIKKEVQLFLSVGMLVLLELGNGDLWNITINNKYIHYISKINPMYYLTANFANIASVDSTVTIGFIYTLFICLEVALILGIMIILNFGYVSQKRLHK